MAAYPAQNYGDAYRDAHSAYQLSLRWLIGGNTSYADHAVEILNGWGSTLRDINGTEDKFLAAGLYGYQFANAAELLRVYPGWTKANQTIFAGMLNDVFAKYNFDFLENHNYKPSFYYANWDLCNIASLMAIGIFSDNRTMYDYAAHYWQYGLPDSSVVVNGALPYFSIANFTEEDSGKQLMEIQESGRDQGHATLCIALLGVIGQQGWNQGLDLFSTYQHEILNAAEYVAKYNTNHTVPYVPYTSWEGLLSAVANKSRSSVRPGYEAVASHYARVKHMNASWSMKYRDYVNQNISAGVEGGGGDYGPNSGGYDAFGHALAFNVTKTLRAQAGYYEGKKCAVLESPAPTAAPCKVSIAPAAASSISSTLTAGQCIAPTPAISCPAKKGGAAINEVTSQLKWWAAGVLPVGTFFI
ncbi:exopolysaccharide inner membrane protein-like protein [Penicillium mononematosum]|uniref:exopolysaccharide inner membrane protein-like protein n=1 Tax=Penicillium mononematosum TaxID=268346 RepID=UPI0025497BE9|nr:exopolysaccharide inner membrane protein-like protein [Penicillium mononematosum]KAJ6191329.1 exopolysaccharide inner membrane protein-like protein [Penicillium mononematosum]